MQPSRAQQISIGTLTKVGQDAKCGTAVKA